MGSATSPQLEDPPNAGLKPLLVNDGQQEQQHARNGYVICRHRQVPPRTMPIRRNLSLSPSSASTRNQEQQQREEEQKESAGAVAKRAFQRGYNVAARVHVYLFGNAIGT